MTWRALFENPLVEQVSPLDYHGHRPQRLALVIPGVPPTDETYFSERLKKITRSKGKLLKTPKVEVIPGAGPEVVAFVDYDVSPQVLFIHYVIVRRDQRGRGYMVQLLDNLIARHRDAEVIDFGDVFSDAVWRYVQRLKSLPDMAGRIRVRLR